MPIRKNNTNKYLRKFENLEKSQDITLPDLFTDSFMQRYTDFQTFQAMLNTCGIKAMKEKTDEFTKFIVAHTRFKTWDEMIKTAGIEHTKRSFST